MAGIEYQHEISPFISPFGEGLGTGALLFYPSTICIGEPSVLRSSTYALQSSRTSQLNDDGHIFKYL